MCRNSRRHWWTPGALALAVAAVAAAPVRAETPVFVTFTVADQGLATYLGPKKPLASKSRWPPGWRRGWGLSSPTGISSRPTRPDSPGWP